MTAIALNESTLQNVKRALRARFPNDKPTHLTEALAAAGGFRTYAALLANVNVADPDYVVLDEAAFLRRREELTNAPTKPEDRLLSFEILSYASSEGIVRTASKQYDRINYSKSKRLRAWRNSMVAGINAGIDQRLFTIRPGDNRWPGASTERFGERKAYVFRFSLNGIPAVASVSDAGWDELAIHVAFWPTIEGERWVQVANAGFLAGDVFASGWLERRDGAWLQVASQSGRGWSFNVRKGRLDRISELNVLAKGFADRGSFKL